MRTRFVVTDRKAPGISDAGARSIRDFKRGFFNAPAVMAALDEAERDRLAKAGDYVKETARRSMRYRKKPSLPGTPPSARGGQAGSLLRKHLYFAFEPSGNTVVVGSAQLRRSIVPRLHEHGGTRQPVRRKPRQVGGTGPVRVLANTGGIQPSKSVKFVKGDPAKRLVVYARLRTPKQAEHATRIEEALYSPLDQKYPPRPFVDPALNNPRSQRFIQRLFSKPL